MEGLIIFSIAILLAEKLLVIMNIAFSEYEIKKHAIFDLIVPFGLIIRVVIPTVFVKFPQYMLNQLREMK